MRGHILLVVAAFAAAPAVSAAHPLCEDPSSYCRQTLDAACIQRERIGAGAIAAADVASTTDCTAQFDHYRECLSRVPTECGAEATPARRACSPEDARQLYGALANTDSIGQLEAFVAACPDTPQAILARARLEDLRSAAPTPEPPSARAPLGSIELPGLVGSTGAPLSAWAGKSRHAGDAFRDCDACPEMVVIPGGAFLMGSPENEPGRQENEGPQRRVEIAAFALGKFEVTFDAWDACAAAGACRDIQRGGGWTDGDQGWGRGARPAVTVSWNDAQDYVSWLNRQVSGAPYRLPSDAEWEYAARAGTTTSYSWGKGYDTAQAADGARTEPVGSYAPNLFGLHDVHGNVREWMQDCWNDALIGAPPDGAVWTSGDCTRAVVRSGSWFDAPQHLRSAARNGTPRGFRSYAVGFRVARSLSETE